MRAWVFWMVLVACSKKSEPPKEGPGSPVAVVPADATLMDAAPVDAAAADPKVAAIPEEGILLATVQDEKLVIAKLDRTGGVQVVHTLAETREFEWLDAKTLVVLQPYAKDDRPAVMKIVDGKPVDTVALGEEWQQASLYVTKGNEVWLERCSAESEGAEECPKTYQRVWPAKQTATKRPKDVVDRSLPSAAGVNAPADIRLAIKKNKPKHGSGFPAVSVFCHGDENSSLYPDIHSDAAQYGYVAKATRWVLEEPPIYEVVADQTNPVGQVETDVLYFEACKTPALDGFVALGGPLWAHYQNDTWTFKINATAVGTLDGGPALRANRW